MQAYAPKTWRSGGSLKLTNGLRKRFYSWNLWPQQTFIWCRQQFLPY